MIAVGLPVHSVVGTTSRVWIKRETATPPESPFYETWWIEAATYAVETTDRDIQRLLDFGGAYVLRVGGRHPERKDDR